MPHLWSVTKIMLDCERIRQFHSLKGQRKIGYLTAYSAPTKKALDPNCDFLLVDNSLAVIFYVVRTAKGADLDLMIRHGQAVMRHRQTGVMIIDLPAGIYENSPKQVLATARLVLDKNGADGVKLEDGSQIVRHNARLIESDIAVLTHIGLLPQKTTSKSGFCITGQTIKEAKKITSDTSPFCDAGIFAILMKSIIKRVAESIALNCQVLKIDVGASLACDGQIVVTEDILGLNDGFTSKFVKKFAHLQICIVSAAAAFHETFVSETFPLKHYLFWSNQ